MKRLILDHFRRRGWMLALFAGFEIFVGFLNVASSSFTTIPITYFEVQIALMMGIMFLFFDLRHGIARTASSLPLTARQIGRAWWLATVGIPSLAIAAFLFLGAGIFHSFHPNAPVHFPPLVMTCVLTLFWMGAGFFVLFKTTSCLRGNRWQRIGGAWGVVYFCGWFCLVLNPGNNSIGLALQLIVGGALTLAGWFRAGSLISGSGHFLLTELPKTHSRGRNRASDGYGGVRRLIIATFIRSFLIGMALVPVMQVPTVLDGQLKSWHQLGESLARPGGFFPYWFFIFLQLMPVLLEMRYLRALPISPTNLAAVMVSIAILPMIALGAVMTGILGLTLGSPQTISFLNGFVFTLAPIAIAVAFAVWRGSGRQAYAALVVILLGSQYVSLEVFSPHQQIPLLLTSALVAIVIALAFLFTRRSLIHSSEPYRIRASSLGNTTWNLGR